MTGLYWLVGAGQIAILDCKMEENKKKNKRMQLILFF